MRCFKRTWDLARFLITERWCWLFYLREFYRRLRRIVRKSGASRLRNVHGNFISRWSLRWIHYDVFWVCNDSIFGLSSPSWPFVLGLRRTTGTKELLLTPVSFWSSFQLVGTIVTHHTNNNYVRQRDARIRKHRLLPYTAFFARNEMQSVILGNSLAL